MTTTTTPPTDVENARADEREWLDKSNPLPTVEEIAGPIIKALFEFAEFTQVAESLAALVSTRDPRDAERLAACRRLLAVHGQIVDLIARAFASCTVDRQREVSTAAAIALNIAVDVSVLRDEIVGEDMFRIYAGTTP